MKKIMLLLLFAVYSGCVPEVKNNVADLEKILASNNFEFYIQSPTRFSGTILFSVEKEGGKYSMGCSESHKTKFITPGQLADFKALLSKLMPSQKEECSKNPKAFKLRAYTYYNDIEYFDCQDHWDEFNTIFDFSELIIRKI